MITTKIQIRNLFGIKEYTQDGGSVELSGKNGVGKTSVIDAIRFALTNKSEREYIVRKGETEGEILIETDTGLRINRKVRTDRVGYKSIKQNGVEVGSPEAFLRDIFTPLQLNPVEFMSMDKKKQNAIILDMIEYSWDMNTIKEWFGEIPSWVSYDQNILQVLNDIQSEKGEYFMHRQDVNRDIRTKRAFIEEIAAGIPEGYSAEKWETASTSAIYHQIEQIRSDNQKIEKAHLLKDARDSKVRSFEADREISKSALDTEFDNRSHQIDKDILKLEEQIKTLKTEQESLDGKKKDKLEIIEQTYKDCSCTCQCCRNRGDFCSDSSTGWIECGISSLSFNVDHYSDHSYYYIDLHCLHSNCKTDGSCEYRIGNYSRSTFGSSCCNW